MADWQVPVISQRTLNLCWEACGHMMWEWRYRNNARMRNLYTRRAGNYARINRGLPEQQMNIFYTRLGIRSLRNPSGRNVRHALRWTPVIVTSTSRVQGHAMIVVGHSGGQYRVVNPCLVQTVDFSRPGADTCTAGTRSMPEADIDNNLGQYIWYW